MTTQISVETLSPVIHNNLPVITTELLAQLYGADVKNIQNNYLRNTDRFIVGKHFYKVMGEELKFLRPSLRGLQISPKTRSLILWTERGAARHAKMLETDQAWEVFEKLEDCYFSQKEKKQSKPTVRGGEPSFRYLVRLTYLDSETGIEETVTGGANFPSEIVQGTAKHFGIYVSEMISMSLTPYC